MVQFSSIDFEDEETNQQHANHPDGMALVVDREYHTTGVRMTPKVLPTFDGKSNWFGFENLVDDWMGVTKLSGRPCAQFPMWVHIALVFAPCSVLECLRLSSFKTQAPVLTELCIAWSRSRDLWVPLFISFVPCFPDLHQTNTVLRIF